jgi:hypothetical protein
MGSSGSNSSLTSSVLLGKHAFNGGLIISLKRKVPYTSNANPNSCKGMNFSHPSPRLTTHMNNVRQVSIVEREVALTDLVTDMPKKLKALL